MASLQAHSARVKHVWYGGKPHTDEWHLDQAGTLINSQLRETHPERLMVVNAIDRCGPPGLLEAQMAQALGANVAKCKRFPHSNAHGTHQVVNKACT